jgi:hypothetical protein
MKVLNGFQRTYLTRKNLPARDFYSCYDAANERYPLITTEGLLNMTQKLLYTLGTSKDEKSFPQPYHCVWLLHSLDDRLQKSKPYASNTNL